ncbi:MAG: hypothetical protein AB7S74_17425 [Hyphomicrobium sp.]
MGIVVELFGPPAAGKTTLARGLSAALSRRFDVRSVSSARPSERESVCSTGSTPFATLLPSISAPLSRAIKLIGVLPALAAGNDAVGVRLLHVLQPARRTDRLRYRRYLAKLAARWRQAQRENAVTVIDQGYHQAVASLLVLGHKTGGPEVRAALEIIPAPHVLIEVKAPIEVVERRLRRRLERQGSLERLFECSLAENLEHINAVAALRTTLMASGKSAIFATTCDDNNDPTITADDLAARITEAIEAYAMTAMATL